MCCGEQRSPRTRNCSPGTRPSAYFSSRSALETLEVALEHREVRRRLRAVCRRLRAYHGMVGSPPGSSIYVGVSAKLCDRLLTYFTAGDDGAKERRIGKHARRIRLGAGQPRIHGPVERAGTDPALATEIQSPWTSGKRALCGYICLTTDEAASALSCGTPSASGCGRSLVGAGTNKSEHCWRRSIDLNHVFQLRDCSRDVPWRLPQTDAPERTGRPAACAGSLASCSSS